MEASLQHEDLLIKLRAKLNEEKIQLWEPPYFSSEEDVPQSFKSLAEKYSKDLAVDYETIAKALKELQIHSLDRSKANQEYKVTGVATFRVKVAIPGEKPKIMKIQKKLNSLGLELISVIAEDISVDSGRIKLIHNGRVIKGSASLEEQGLKNGAQLMALVMAEAPEEVKKEDKMYMEMKKTRDDAALLSECVDELADDDDEYIKLEDQSGKTVELPPAERRSLLVGLALHERGRAAAKQKDYPLALVLLLEADSQLSECRSSLLKTVDNWAVLQLDIAWCYLCLQNLSSAADAAARLQRAEESFKHTYGESHERLIALKGTAANERVLLMRLYLLQGIVAYHQNKRVEAKRLLDKAEAELGCLRVDENSVLALMELGWTRAAARSGLRASAGDVDRAHHYLADRRTQKNEAREKHRQERQARLAGLCLDGSPVNPQLVEGLIGMGYSRKIAVTALRNSNNHVAEAVRIIQEQPELLAESDASTDSESPSSDDYLVEPDERMISKLEAMGYCTEDANTALMLSRNNISRAVDLLTSGQLTDGLSEAEAANPSTSSGVTPKRKRTKHKKDKRKKERESALHRLSSAIRAEEDDYLDTSLVEEEEYLAQYKSLL